MKTIKPLTLGVLHRVVEHTGKLHFAVTGLVLVPLGEVSAEAAPFPLSEMALWKHVGEELGPNLGVDEAWPKSRGEVLVSGSAFVPGGSPDIACDARVSCGAIQKTLRIVGDRAWDRLGSATRPTPFTEMPLGWERAFGGEGFAENPRGKGFAARDGVHALPNVEDPSAMIRTSSNRPSPAGFGAVPLGWPQRSSKLGTYDNRWLREDAPGFARDIDWTAFNVAPTDQWIEGFFRGDEAYVLENLHPTAARLEGRLPDLAVRFFVNRRAPEGGVEAFDEIATRLDTIHFLPRARVAVLVYRGVAQVTEDDADDVLQLVGSIERRGEPRSIEHYREVLRVRLDPQKGARHTFRDRDLTPPGAPPTFESLDDGGPKRQDLLAARNHRRAERELEASRERLRARGMNPDEHLPRTLPAPEPKTPLDDLPEALDKAEALAAEQRASSHARRLEAEGKARELADKNGIDFDRMVARAKASRERPSPHSVDALLVMARAQLIAAKERGVDVSKLEAKLDDPQHRAQLERTRAHLVRGYRMSAHHMTPLEPLPDTVRLDRRRDVLGRLERGESLAGVDLTGVDLSGMDFAKLSAVGTTIDFSEALMEEASFRGSNLTGARFSNTLLARADFTGANLEGASFAGANLGFAILRGARAEAAIDLSGAILWGTDLAGAALHGATLGRTTVFEAKLEGADLRGLSAAKAMFFQTDLGGAALEGADLSGCTLMECTLARTDFSRATLEGTTFVKCQGEGAVFTAAKARNLRVVHGTALERASFVDAELTGSSFRGARLAAATFAGAVIDQSDFSGADLTGAIFFAVSGRDARFVRADLGGATLLQARLLGAILQKASIEGADFTDANLFGADLARVHGRPKSLEGAELGRVRVTTQGVRSQA